MFKTLLFFFALIAFASVGYAQCNCQVANLAEGGYTGADIFNCSGDDSCNTVPCDTCKIFSITFTGGPNCCADEIEIIGDGSTCFVGCGFLVVPTHPTWDSNRNDCDTSKISLTPAPGESDICNGQSLAMRICATGSMTVTINAKCNSNVIATVHVPIP